MAGFLERWQQRGARRRLSLPERLLAHFPGAALLADAQGVVQEVSPSVERCCGHAADRLLGHRVTGLDVDPLHGELARALAFCVEQRRPWRGLVLCRRDDGRTVHQDTLMQPLEAGPGEALQLLIVLHDVTMLREPALADHARLTRLEDSLTRLPGAVFQLRQQASGRLEFLSLSGGFPALVGLAAEAVMERPSLLFERVAEEEREALYTSLIQSAVSLDTWQQAFRLEMPEGSCWLEATARPQRLGDGVTLWDGWLQDVTRRKEEELRTQRLVTTDMLTGVLNRRAFFTSGEAIRAQAARYGRQVPVAMIDLDHFKTLNDTHGHAAGDLALQRFAMTCRDCLRPYDLLARIGGEEFAVMLVDSTAEEAWRVLERLRSAVAAVELVVDRVPLRFTVSMGLAFLEPDGDLHEVLARADQALYCAKHEGRNRIVGPRESSQASMS